MSTPPVRPPSGTNPARAAEQNGFGALRSRVIRYLQCPDLVREINVDAVYQALRRFMDLAVPDAVFEPYYRTIGIENPPGSGRAIKEPAHRIFEVAQNLSHAFLTDPAIIGILKFACPLGRNQRANLVEVGCGRGFLLRLLEQKKEEVRQKGSEIPLDLAGIELGTPQEVEDAEIALARVLEQGEDSTIAKRFRIALPTHPYRSGCCGSDPLQHIQPSRDNVVEVTKVAGSLKGLPPLCKTPIQRKTSEKRVLESVAAEARKGNATLLVSWFHYNHQEDFSRILKAFYDAGGERVIVIGDLTDGYTASLQSVDHPNRPANPGFNEGSWELDGEYGWRKDVFEMGLMLGDLEQNVRFYRRKGLPEKAAAGSAAASAATTHPRKSK